MAPHVQIVTMPPKKKGKKKKTIEPITDPETLRVIGTVLEGTEMTLVVQYDKLGGSPAFTLNLTDIATVADLYQMFWQITNSKPGTEYIFCGSLPNCFITWVYCARRAGRAPRLPGGPPSSSGATWSLQLVPGELGGPLGSQELPPAPLVQVVFWYRDHRLASKAFCIVCSFRENQRSGE